MYKSGAAKFPPEQVQTPPQVSQPMSRHPMPSQSCACSCGVTASYSHQPWQVTQSKSVTRHPCSHHAVSSHTDPGDLISPRSLAGWLQQTGDELDIRDRWRAQRSKSGFLQSNLYRYVRRQVKIHSWLDIPISVDLG